MNTVHTSALPFKDNLRLISLQLEVGPEPHPKDADESVATPPST